MSDRRVFGVLMLLLVIEACSTDPLRPSGDPDSGGAADASSDVQQWDNGGEPPGGSCQPVVADAQDGVGPKVVGSVLMGDSRPEGLGIHAASVSTRTLEIAGEPIVAIRFSMTSFVSHFGRPWQHTVTILSPRWSGLSTSEAAVFCAGRATLNPVGPEDEDPTWGTEHPPWFSGTDNEEHLLRTYSSLVTDYGVPVVITDIVPDAIELESALAAEIQESFEAAGQQCAASACTGEITHEGAITSCLQRAAIVREDLRYYPALSFAVAGMRIMDAAEHVLETVYVNHGNPGDLSWRQAWAIGSSKRGNAVRLLATLDDRVTGVVVAAADLSNLARLSEWERTLWSGARSFHLDTLGPLWETDFGQELLRSTDTFRWAPAVLDGVHYVLAVGTRDPLFPLGTSLGYLNALPPDRHFVLVPNYGHGWGAVDITGALRALIDHQLNGAPWPTLEASWRLDSDRVQVQVMGGIASDVALWCATGLQTNSAVMDVLPDCSKEVLNPEDGPDLRHARWQQFPLDALGDGRYEGQVPPSGLSYPACMVRGVTEEGKPFTSYPLLSRPLCEAYGLTW